MASRFQVAALAGAPAYPAAIAWSDENLIAVASDHLVTILNPASPLGPRGLVTLNSAEPFPIGVVDTTELFSASLIPISLARDTQPCVRSVSWSPIGLAPNSGCLLAVCTTEGRVKLYRQPFCDFSAEWIEVVDISTKLCNYLESISFDESKFCSSIDSSEAEETCSGMPSMSASRKERKRRKFDLYDITDADIDQLEEIGSKKTVSASKSKTHTSKKKPENMQLPRISAEKYVARSAMLSSLVVAWSPVLQLSPRVCSIPLNCSPAALLAVGDKSGEVSLWRVSTPQSYSIEPSHVLTTPMLLGLLKAHSSWITAVAWALLEPEDSNPLVLLVTGSSDGSVKIWLAYTDQLLKSTEVNNATFSPLKEVVTVDIVPVSVISLTVPARSSNKMLLAVGKGAGSFEVWTCDLSNSKYYKFGSYDAHDNIVTGLAWAFNGNCLYTCSQDNFVRSWILCEDVLIEASIPSNTPRLKSSTEISDVFVSCLGSAVSPGNLAIAVVRNFDEDLLDPMYQKRTQKAAVEFFWIGAQEVSIPTKDLSPFLIPGFPVKELVSWEVNILWSLKQYQFQNKPLAVWDIIAAMLAFKNCAPEYVEHILIKWLSTSSIGVHSDLSAEKVLLHVATLFSEMSSRRLHLLNIICRRIVLPDLKADQINKKLQNLTELDFSEEKLMWMDFLSSSERELRERLVGLSFAYCKARILASSTDSSFPCSDWNIGGLAQMDKWITLNHDHVKNRLRVLASEVQKHGNRLKSNKHIASEQCCFCSASVPFESPEVAYCQGVKKGHKLARCAVSMKICPATPTWFCTCCHRRAFKLTPEALFTLTRYPLEFDPIVESRASSSSKPLCPFCGILLQRQQPDFLLSVSPV